MIDSAPAFPDFEQEVRRRLGITGNDFLARLKFDELDDFSKDEVLYLLSLLEEGNSGSHE